MTYPYLASEEISDEGNLFNPKQFRQSSYLTILNSVRSFLQLNPVLRQRQPKMLETALRSLQVLNVLSHFPVGIQRMLVAKSYLEIFKPGKIITKTSHRPERYYIVVSGQGMVISLDLSCITVLCSYFSYFFRFWIENYEHGTVLNDCEIA